MAQLKRKVTVYLDLAEWQFLNLVGVREKLAVATIATQLLREKISEEQSAVAAAEAAVTAIDNG